MAAKFTQQPKSTQVHNKLHNQNLRGCSKLKSTLQTDVRWFSKTYRVSWTWWGILWHKFNSNPWFVMDSNFGPTSSFDKEQNKRKESRTSDSLHKFLWKHNIIKRGIKNNYQPRNRVLDMVYCSTIKFRSHVNMEIDLFTFISAYGWRKSVKVWKVRQLLSGFRQFPLF